MVVKKGLHVGATDRTAAMSRAAIVLCGGRSRRMGRDKASLPFGTETLLERVVRIVSEVVG